MAMTHDQELSRQTKKSVNFKGLFEGLTTVTALMTAFLFKLLVLVIKTPFFILFYLKNWAIIGVMSSTFYGIIGYLYYSNQPQYQSFEHNFFRELLWTDTRFMIIVIISAILAFFATYGEFTD
ncbi:hypothetical protein ACR3IL_09045 [Streptococcus iniae]|uniref:hypothetical protein n=1 Tax=Streptococcus agalactiae TaxID=1311 RepID=UPI0008D9BA3E|nr:hypothetical protein [Streptococcus agalactiae]ELY5747367.1 hypothetical protein [Streptococcus iniae]KAF0052052.1 hypothetical protein GL192_00800 [Streptococcus agalactiae]OHX26616.1 hypothetical protein BKX95_09570 [Streptococcus iniae]